mmetsp:Transcript_5952/g.10959  ORF Transcript_5952/g.10959 Transcript_5952/m.10959 type:complete len:665 (+) Transcript_5952:59-2053(+)
MATPRPGLPFASPVTTRRGNTPIASHASQDPTRRHLSAVATSMGLRRMGDLKVKVAGRQAAQNCTQTTSYTLNISGPRGVHVVQREYSDFEELHQKFFGNGSLGVPMPSKTFFVCCFSPGGRGSLENALEEVVAEALATVVSKGVEDCPASLCQFLGLMEVDKDTATQRALLDPEEAKAKAEDFLAFMPLTEAAARAEADRLEAKLAAAKAESQRLAAEVASRAERFPQLAAKASMKAEQTRLAADAAAKAKHLAAEAARAARAQTAAKAEQERLAAEAAAKAEAHRLAAEAAALAEQERVGAEAAAKAEQERLAAEKANADRVEAQAAAKAMAAAKAVATARKSQLELKSRSLSGAGSASSGHGAATELQKETVRYLRRSNTFLTILAIVIVVVLPAVMWYKMRSMGISSFQALVADHSKLLDANSHHFDTEHSQRVQDISALQKRMDGEASAWAAWSAKFSGIVAKERAEQAHAFAAVNPSIQEVNQRIDTESSDLAKEAAKSKQLLDDELADYKKFDFSSRIAPVAKSLSEESAGRAQATSKTAEPVDAYTQNSTWWQPVNAATKSMHSEISERTSSIAAANHDIDGWPNFEESLYFLKSVEDKIRDGVCAYCLSCGGKWAMTFGQVRGEFGRIRRRAQHCEGGFANLHGEEEFHVCCAIV